MFPHKIRFVIFLNLMISINCCEDFWKDWFSCSPDNTCYLSEKSKAEIVGNTMTIMCGKDHIDLRLMRCLDTRNIQKLQINHCHATHFDVRSFVSSDAITEVNIFTTTLPKNFESIAFTDMPLLKTVKISGTSELVNLTLDNLPSLVDLRVHKYSIYMQEERNYWYGALNIPPKLFNEVPNLRRLDLSYNNIDSLDQSVFRKLTQLEYLNLEGNEIKVLPGKLLRGLSNLRVIFIAFNWELDSIPSGFLKGLINLTEFYAGNCSLSKIKEDLFTDAINLEIIDLDTNKIDHLPSGVFKNNQNLRELHCYGNRISTLPDGIFDGLSKLKMIILGNNQLSDLPEDIFRNLPSLESLNLAENRITSLPENIFFSLNNLRILVLSSNNLRSISGEIFGRSKHLGYIILSNTSLSEWPVINWEKHNLTYVDFSFNHFEIVKLPIYTPNSMTFRLSDCKIKTVYIDDEIYGFNTPTYYLSNNPIYSLERMQNTD
ncbi:platelet glycoprotein V-like [Centruroides sculpturatus]|uniref:platelet glycoprotein V-like n=1 Tax=Centruroides sculpturatus TaxID=218467 RepID=UPI000C6CE179|nr:platelet glycoprotein V-like [Centruroides sculpturatus]